MRRIATWLTILLVFTIPIENFATIGGIGSVARLAGLLATISWLVNVTLSRQIRRPHPFHAAVAAFLVWALASVYWTVDVNLTNFRLVTYVQLGVLIYVLWDVLNTREQVNYTLQAFVLGCYILAINTIFNFIIGQPVAQYSTRYSATNTDANEMGIMLAVAMVFAWYLNTNAKQSTGKTIFTVLNYLFIPLAIFAILLAASRSATIALLPASIYILATLTRLRVWTRLLVFGILVYGIIVLRPLVPNTSFERISETRSSLTAGDLTGRGDIWREGVEVFLNEPILGVGGGAFPAVNRFHYAPHNVMLAVATELGIIGVVLFSLVLLTVFLAMLKQRRPERWLWLVVLMIWTIGAATLTWDYSKVTWIIFSLVIISGNVIATEPVNTFESTSRRLEIDRNPLPT